MGLIIAEDKMAAHLESLMYWESPAHSAAVFLPALAVLAGLASRYFLVS